MIFTSSWYIIILCSIMKPTPVLQHAKKFWWGKGWGTRPRINTDNFYYRRQIRDHAVRPLEVVEQTLPEGVVPIDANDYIRKEFNREKNSGLPSFELPWPYSERPIKGTPDDPKYQSVPALVYQRHKRLLEPINLPLVFTNSVLEDNLPEQVQSLVDQVQLEPEFVDLARKRVNWCLTNDSAMRKLPKNKEFPYLDQNPPRCYGITSNRKESNMLQAFFDLANLWIGRHVTNSKLIIQRFSYPNCVHQFDRDQRKVVLDLECDFVSLVTSPDKVSRLCLKEFDANYQTNTRDRSLVSIRPLSWAVGLDTKNFYNTSIEFKTPPNSALQSIFLSNNNVRNLNNEDFQGRSIMFSYGYALKQAQLISGVGAGQPLDRSIPLQCIFTNPKDNSLGFVLFQLNTTKWNDDDQDVRNQVWLGQTATVADDNGLEVILKQLIALQMRSLV